MMPTNSFTSEGESPQLQADSPRLKIKDITEARAAFKSVLEREGIRAALCFLNWLTRHRFTSLYQFDNQMLRSVYFFDRENPLSVASPDIPITASYCVFIRDQGVPFATADAKNDHRVDSHPNRNHVQSYYGVPLLNRAGGVFGSLCHFDLKPLPVTKEDVRLLESAAELMQEQLLESVLRS